MTVRRKQLESKVKTHAFEDVDETGAPVPPDYGGKKFCGRCGLPGEAGDDRHPLDAPRLPRDTTFPAPPPGADQFDARRLGEKGAPDDRHG